MLAATSVAFVFQTVTFILSFNGILLQGVSRVQAEIFLGFGYFYYWSFLYLIPPFFLFGYFQILIIKYIYRFFKDQSEKRSGSWKKFLSITGIVFTVLALFAWIFGYYVLFSVTGVLAEGRILGPFTGAWFSNLVGGIVGFLLIFSKERS